MPSFNIRLISSIYVTVIIIFIYLHDQDLPYVLYQKLLVHAELDFRGSTSTRRHRNVNYFFTVVVVAMAIIFERENFVKTPVNLTKVN